MFQKLLASLDKGHIVIGLGVFTTGTALSYYHRLDAQFVAFATAVLGYLGSHLYITNQGQQ
jgi:hypothetical protein